MNNSHNFPYKATIANQQGAVLIVVLLFLILIVFVGVIAVRNSSTDLRLAASDQVNTVLLQSSDSVNNKIEMSVNADSLSEEHKQIMGYTGIFGYYILNDSARDDIIDFCYRPRSGFFNIDRAVIRRNQGTLVNNSEGYCDPTAKTDYTSARNTIMTQVMVKNVSKEVNTEAFSHMNLGSDSESRTAKMHTFDIYSTSVLPAYGGAREAKVKDCFKKDASAATDNVVTCLTDSNIPNKMLVEQVDVANIQNADFCNYFGTGGSGSKNPLCKGVQAMVILINSLDFANEFCGAQEIIL